MLLKVDRKENTMIFERSTAGRASGHIVLHMVLLSLSLYVLGEFVQVRPVLASSSKSPNGMNNCAREWHRNSDRKIAHDSTGDSNIQSIAENTKQICISYNDIDRAIELAKKKTNFMDSLTDLIKAPSGETGKLFHILNTSLALESFVLDTIGELNKVTTQAIAEQFQLTRDEIINALPSVDMSKSSFWPLCPLLVRDQDIKCEPSRYRSFTGHCNNLEHPTWGAAMTSYRRHLAPAYDDGMRTPRHSVLASEASSKLTGVIHHKLPPPRLVSLTVHREAGLPSHDYTTLFMSWGQLIAHDVSHASFSVDFLQCCIDDGLQKSRHCAHIDISPNDPFYSKHNVTCLSVHRSLAGLHSNCALGPQVPLNSATSTIDASTVYGSSPAEADSLRHFEGGRLEHRNLFEQEGLKPLLPAQVDDPELACLNLEGFACFAAGDKRSNTQIQLTALHTLYVREHNRLADPLAEINPHWSDEQLYQETRRIVAAGVQHVLISEYLPSLLGVETIKSYNLSACGDRLQYLYCISDAYWLGYDSGATTSISVAFEAAAFRVGHILIPDHFELYNRNHELVSSEQMRNVVNRPWLLYQAGALDQFVGGMINQPSQSFDPFSNEDVSNCIFRLKDVAHGQDLLSINIERGRDQGLPGYNSFREWCGLGRVESFEQLALHLTNNTAYLYSTLYRHVDDIDLWSAGVSERKLPGASVGPTFACILGSQFRDIRRGDRFWYENPNLPSSFSPGQLAELRKITLAKILCQNSDDLPTIQRWPMQLPHPVTNPRLRCEDLPEINLDHWRDTV